MLSPNVIQAPLTLIPGYRDYVWGGRRLRPQVSGPTAEAWIIFEGNALAGEEPDSVTLQMAADRFGADLLGTRTLQRSGLRFPILIKIIDTAAWLSLQVHPNDEQAARLEGPGFFGKMEAWYFIEADPQAEILCGMKPGSSTESLTDAIRRGTIVEAMQRHLIQAGDCTLIPPGTIHALGPGLLVYEVQQTSDITYRVFDWNRPARTGRALHIEKSIAVSNPSQEIRMIHSSEDNVSGLKTLVSCEFFSLSLASLTHETLAMDTKGETFHALTSVSGKAALNGQGWDRTLNKYESILIPAALGRYDIRPLENAKILISSA